MRHFPQDLRLIFDRQGRCTRVNRAARDLFGEASTPGWPEMAGRFFETTLERVITSGECAEEELTLTTASGDRLYNWRYIPRFGGGGEVSRIVLTGRDISDRRHFEGLLWRSRRMESVAALAGGVAHEFNNILTMVMGAATILEMRLRNDVELGPFVRQVLDSSERAAAIVRDLLLFGRRQPVSGAARDLNQLVADLTVSIERVIAPDSRLAVESGTEPLMVVVDGVQIEQVLLSLAANARDAMSSGGVVEVRVSLAEPEQLPLVPSLCCAGRWALITVRDNGCGMDAATLDRVFEPYFTTRRPGWGAGLGLSVSYGIIAQHGGLMTAESTPGRGSIFSVYLPLAERGEAHVSVS